MKLIRQPIFTEHLFKYGFTTFGVRPVMARTPMISPAEVQAAMMLSTPIEPPCTESRTFLVLSFMLLEKNIGPMKVAAMPSTAARDVLVFNTRSVKNTTTIGRKKAHFSLMIFRALGSWSLGTPTRCVLTASRSTIMKMAREVQYGGDDGL